MVADVHDAGKATVHDVEANNVEVDRIWDEPVVGVDIVGFAFEVDKEWSDTIESIIIEDMNKQLRGWADTLDNVGIFARSYSVLRRIGIVSQDLINIDGYV